MHLRLYFTNEKAINNWVKSSEYDIRTAEALYGGKRFVYVIFMQKLIINVPPAVT